MVDLGRHQWGSAAVSLATVWSPQAQTFHQHLFDLPRPCLGPWSGHHEIVPPMLADDPAHCSQDIPYGMMCSGTLKGHACLRLSSGVPTCPADMLERSRQYNCLQAPGASYLQLIYGGLLLLDDGVQILICCFGICQLLLQKCHLRVLLSIPGLCARLIAPWQGRHRSPEIAQADWTTQRMA